MKVRGVVKGNTIVLDETVKLSEGQRVVVDVQSLEEDASSADSLKAQADGDEFDTNKLVNELREELGI